MTIIMTIIDNNDDNNNDDDVGRSAHIRGASVLCLKAVFVWNLIWLIYTTFVYLQSYKIL